MTVLDWLATAGMLLAVLALARAALQAWYTWRYSAKRKHQGRSS